MACGATRVSVLKRALQIAYRANVTGSASMVAYNAVMAVVPLTLLGLFAVGAVVGNPGAKTALLDDLEMIFPTAARSSLDGALATVRDRTVELGAGALLSGAWVGISLWSALDSACCRIYDLPCRDWVEQKRFGAAMLLVGFVLVLLAAAVPALHSVVLVGSGSLPFGLDGASTAGLLAGLAAGHLFLFVALFGLYRAVPNSRVPWGSTWPGAVFATFAVSAVSYVFPLYLSNIATLAHAGAAFAFAVIVLAWFYALALAILLGAALNAARMQTTALRGRPDRSGTSARSRLGGEGVS